MLVSFDAENLEHCISLYECLDSVSIFAEEKQSW